MCVIQIDFKTRSANLVTGIMKLTNFYGAQIVCKGEKSSKSDNPLTPGDMRAVF